MTDKKQSWFSKILGRSVIKIIFGNFFENKNNTAAVIAITLTGTLCYIAIHNLVNVNPISTELDILANIIFVIIGYYFGAKQESTSNDE